MASASDESIIYGPNTDETLVTTGLNNNQEIRLVSGRHPFKAKIVRVIDSKFAIVIREFPTSGKWSKPFKAHISAIERLEPVHA